MAGQCRIRRRPADVAARRGFRWPGTGKLVERLLAEIGDRVGLSFLALTGLRVGEALAVTWGDIQPGPVICVRASKTPSGVRNVALMPQLSGALIKQRAVARFPADTDPIFCTAMGNVQCAHNVRNRLRKVTKPLGLEWATPHSFRHSLGTVMIEQGFAPTIVQKVLGHAQLSTTLDYYVHGKEAPRFDELVIGAAE